MVLHSLIKGLDIAVRWAHAVPLVGRSDLLILAREDQLKNESKNHKKAAKFKIKNSQISQKLSKMKKKEEIWLKIDSERPMW